MSPSPAYAGTCPASGSVEGKTGYNY
jgi:hypothetical protein